MRQNPSYDAGRTLPPDKQQGCNHLACSLETKSEIVVPVFVKNRVVGELDIDSHFISAFDDEDQDLVEHYANAVGAFLEKHPRRSH